LASLNSLINLSFQLRDSPESEIDSYLTNGTKSIPILIGRQNGNDLFVWGPRPATCQKLIDSLKDQEVDFNTMKEEIQKWYNADQGRLIQSEIIELLNLR
jgi:hypothetical protein